MGISRWMINLATAVHRPHPRRRRRDDDLYPSFYVTPLEHRRVLNVAPVITIGEGDSAIGQVVESDAQNLTDTGSLSVTDLDALDTVTAAVDSVQVTAGSDNGIDNGTFEAMMTVAPNPIIGPEETTGSITWTFDSGSETFDYLADGESLELTYTLSATDDSGMQPNSATQAVVVTIVGTNDSPVITVGEGDSTIGLVVESDAQNLTDTGSLSVEDLDVTDTVTAGVNSVEVTAGNDNGIDNGTFEAMMTVAPNPIIGPEDTTGSITWTFDSGSETFDYLADGESLELTYTLSATDDSGTQPNSATQTVVVTIIGTNDSPTLSGLDDVTFTGNDLETPNLIDSDVTFQDADTPDYSGGSLTVTLLSGSEEGTLSIIEGGGISLDDNFVFYDDGSGAQSIGYIDPAQEGGQDLVIYFTEGATPDAVEKLIERLGYQNSSATPPQTWTIEIAVEEPPGEFTNETARGELTITLLPPFPGPPPVPPPPPPVPENADQEDPPKNTLALRAGSTEDLPRTGFATADEELWLRGSFSNWEKLSRFDAASRPVKREVVVFMVTPVDDDGHVQLTEVLRIEAKNALRDLPGLLQRLPDDRYQIHLERTRGERLVESRLIREVVMREGNPAELGDAWEEGHPAGDDIRELLDADSLGVEADPAERPLDSPASSSGEMDLPVPIDPAPEPGDNAAARGAGAAAIVAAPLTAAAWQQRIDQAISQHSDRLLTKSARILRRANPNPNSRACRNDG